MQHGPHVGRGESVGSAYVLHAIAFVIFQTSVVCAYIQASFVIGSDADYGVLDCSAVFVDISLFTCGKVVPQKPVAVSSEPY